MSSSQPPEESEEAPSETDPSPPATDTTTAASPSVVPGPDVSAYSPLIQPNVSTFVISGGRDPFMRNLNTIEKVELGGSCKLTPKKFKKMPFAVYDHMSFYVSDQFIFCGGHKRPGVVR